VSDVSAGTEVEPRVSVGAAGAVSAGVAVNTTEAGADTPPRLVQVSVKVSVPTAVGVIVSCPFAGRSVPLQLPDAVQLVAPSESHVMVVDLPTATDADASCKSGFSGALPEVTVSVTELAASVRAELVQVSRYVGVPAAFGVSTTLPLVACVPLQSPDAAQLAAWTADHVSLVELPSGMDCAAKVSVGTTSAVSA
jgi:hypothetical protein